MEATKRYITQLTSSDLKELSEVTRIVQGDGISIKRENGYIVIGIDKDKLRALLNVI